MLYVTFVTEKLGITRASKNVTQEQERNIQLYMNHFCKEEIAISGKPTGGCSLLECLTSEDNAYTWVVKDSSK